MYAFVNFQGRTVLGRWAAAILTQNLPRCCLIQNLHMRCLQWSCTVTSPCTC